MATAELEQATPAEDLSAAGDELQTLETPAPDRTEVPEAAPATAEAETHLASTPPDSPPPVSRLREQRQQDMAARRRETGNTCDALVHQNVQPLLQSGNASTHDASGNAYKPPWEEGQADSQTAGRSPDRLG
ncbi:UNVERIFIED_CONTAM: hypothetical protein K2H54_039168 [Gekko kuhli]